MRRKPNAETRTETPEQPPTAAAARSAEDRRRRIAECAYYKAERRGFDGGDPCRDWLEAEAEIEAAEAGGGDDLPA